MYIKRNLSFWQPRVGFDLLIVRELKGRGFQWNGPRFTLTSQFAAFNMDHDVILWFIQINWTNIYEKFITRIYSVHHLGNNDKQMMTGGMGEEKRVNSSEHLNIFDNMLSKHKLAFEMSSTALTAIWYSWNLVVIVSSVQSAAPHSIPSSPSPSSGEQLNYIFRMQCLRQPNRMGGWSKLCTRLSRNYQRGEWTQNYVQHNSSPLVTLHSFHRH